jgi:hypothetical protein
MTASILASIAVTVPNTKKLGSLETPRQKVVRRVLRAYKAAQAQLGQPREAEFAAKVAHQYGKLALLQGNPTVWGDAPADAAETLALQLAGIVEAPKPAKAPARKKAAAKTKAAKPAKVAEEAATAE